MATPTPTPGPDSDGDGVPDASDNCPTVPNADQDDWNLDNIGDACQDFDLDSLGFSGAQVGGFCPSPLAVPWLRDCIELSLGTAQDIACSATTIANDEAIDAWGPDFNDDRAVNSLDVFKFAQRFGSTPSFTPDGKLPYAARYDLNAAGGINVLDVFIFAQYFNKTCS